MWFIVGFTTPVANEELNHTGELARDNMMCLAYSMQHAYIYIHTYIYRIYCICHYFHPLDNSCPHATWKMTRKHVCCPHIQDHHGQITAPLFGRTTWGRKRSRLRRNPKSAASSTWNHDEISRSSSLGFQKRTSRTRPNPAVKISSRYKINGWAKNG